MSKLHIDEDVGSPTLYGFQLQVTDHKKQASADIAYVQYTKGEWVGLYLEWAFTK